MIFPLLSKIQKWFILLIFSEEAEKPADLSQKIVFKVKKKDIADVSTADNKDEKPAEKSNKDSKSKRKKTKPMKSLLSFEDDEDEWSLRQFS